MRMRADAGTGNKTVKSRWSSCQNAGDGRLATVSRCQIDVDIGVAQIYANHSMPKPM